MRAINIESTDDTPKVILDKDANKFEFSGKSLPHNPSKFYYPIIDWIVEYGADPNTRTEVYFRMDYFNTASSKMILDIFEKLEAIYKNGHDVEIFWYHDEDDVDMEEAGEEYSEIVDVPIKLKTYED